jgi:hypothetical protein
MSDLEVFKASNAGLTSEVLELRAVNAEQAMTNELLRKELNRRCVINAALLEALKSIVLADTLDGAQEIACNAIAIAIAKEGQP